MKYLIWAIVAAVGLYLLDRAALWAEGRGWIFYRRRHASSGTMSNAFLEVMKVFDPGKRHVIEERVNKGPATQESGDKPKPGGPA